MTSFVKLGWRLERTVIKQACDSQKITAEKRKLVDCPVARIQSKTEIQEAWSLVVIKNKSFASQGEGKAQSLGGHITWQCENINE